MSLSLARQDDRADVVSVTGNYTIGSTSTGVVLVTTGSSDVTVTLPAVSSSSKRYALIKKVDSGSGRVLITRSGSDTIEGQTTVYIYKQYDQMELTNDGSTTWVVFSERITPVTFTAYDTGTTETSVTAANSTGQSSAALTFDSKTSDNYSAFTSNTTFTVPAGMGGIYEFVTHSRFRSGAFASNGDGTANLYLSVNGGVSGTPFASGQLRNNGGLATGSPAGYISGTVQVTLSAGDTVSLKLAVFGGTGGGSDIMRVQSPMFTAKLLQRIR